MWGSQWTVFLVYLVSQALAHHYRPHDSVQVWADRAGLYDFPLETYSFSSLPLCELWENDPATPSTSASRRPLSFGELLEGKRAYNSQRIRITWPDNNATSNIPESKAIQVHEICRMKLTRQLVTSLNTLVRRKVWLSYDIDGIPIYGLIGSVTDSQFSNSSSSSPRLFSHKTFIIERNNDQIVGAALNMSSPIELKPNKVLRLTYAVNFVESNKPYNARLQPFFNGETPTIKGHAQFISTAVCFGVGLLFTGSAALIISQGMSKRTEPLLSLDIEATPNSSRFGEPGYRAVAREVFKQPKYLTMHTVIVGSGVQITAATVITAVLCAINAHYGLNVAPTNSFIRIYTICQPINGAMGAIDFLTNWRKHESSRMVGMQTAAFWQLVTFPVILVAAFIQLNTVNAIYGSSKAIDFLQLLYQLMAFVLVNGVLQSIGTYLGFLICRESKPPVPPNTLERPVFKTAKTLRRKIIFITALIPFAAICTETYIIYKSLWKGWSAISLDYLVVTSVLFIALVTCASLIGLCILLQAEDHKWHWFPMKCGAITAGCFICQTFIQYLMIQNGPTHVDDTAASSNYLRALTYWTTTLYISMGIFMCSSSIGYLCCSVYIHRLYSTSP